jgi:DNA ligase 1
LVGKAVHVPLRSDAGYNDTMDLPISPPLSPMLAKGTDTVPEGRGLIYEPKWDGFRVIVFRDGDEVLLQSRDGKALQRFFPEVVAAVLEQLPPRCVVDGELVIRTRRGLDFDVLQLRLHPAESRVKKLSVQTPASLVLWDVLALGDADYRAFPFTARRAWLEDLFSLKAPLLLSPVTHSVEVARDWFTRFEGAGFDGVMAKPGDQPYAEGKRTLTKVKHARTVDAVVLGFRWHKVPGKVGSLILALYREGELRPIGVASGFSAKLREEMTELLVPLKAQTAKPPPNAQGATSRWNPGKSLRWETLVEPRVAEVGFNHIDRRLRHPARFKRWRLDKSPEDCTWDQVQVAAPALLSRLLPDVVETEPEPETDLETETETETEPESEPEPEVEPQPDLQLAQLANTWARMRTTRSRKQKTGMLVELLTPLNDRDLGLAVAWLTGKLQQGKIGVGFAAAYGAVKKARPAESPSLATAQVEALFDEVQVMEGAGSQAARDAALVGLFERATELEQGFLVGLLTGELRQGSLAGLMVEGIAKTMDIPKPAVQRAAMLSGDLRTVALAARDGVAALEAFVITPFTPLLPMLAKPAKTPEFVLELHTTAAFEAKLDGVRIQVHRVGDEVLIYTRTLKEISRLIPEVVEAALALDCTRCILDGELLALDDSGRPRNFQTVMSRFGRNIDKRHHPVLMDEVPVTPHYFDVLLVDDEAMLDLPLVQRRARLEALVPSLHCVQRLVTSSAEEAALFIEQVLEHGHEGVIAKSLDAVYEAGGRGNAWLKLKPAYSFDLVVLGADWGSGRREGTLSNIHLAARDAATGELKMLGKTFKGMTDELLAWQTRTFQELETHRTDWTVFIRPELVVEVIADSVMASRRYPAGISLRFARVKEYRADKTPETASTIDELRAFIKD